MLAGALRHHHNQPDDQHHAEHGRCIEPANGQGRQPETGLSRKSPTVAPSGLVRMNALQNSSVRETLVKKYGATDQHQRRTEHQRAAFVAEAVEKSAIQSPSAVPRVCENRIAVQ